ncbi:thioredoxin [Candidatus Uhrbacteria bacterium]|nr:thioredoxin [Candidatus Uhrbacteria bacterium]
MSFVFTDDNFEQEALKAGEPVLVDFWAPWCGPCQMMAPVVDELAAEYEGKVKIGKLNVDENQVIAGKYGIMSIPTMLLFKDGAVAEQFVGGMSKEDLKAKIDAAV